MARERGRYDFSLAISRPRSGLGPRARLARRGAHDRLDQRLAMGPAARRCQASPLRAGIAGTWASPASARTAASIPSTHLFDDGYGALELIARGEQPRFSAPRRRGRRSPLAYSRRPTPTAPPPSGLPGQFLNRYLKVNGNAVFESIRDAAAEPHTWTGRFPPPSCSSRLSLAMPIAPGSVGARRCSWRPACGRIAAPATPSPRTISSTILACTTSCLTVSERDWDALQAAPTDTYITADLRWNGVTVRNSASDRGATARETGGKPGCAWT